MPRGHKLVQRFTLTHADHRMCFIRPLHHCPMGDRIIDIGPPEWCWSHLSDADEGTLSFRTSRGLITVAVPYTIADQITIPVAPFNDTAWLATPRVATLEVTGHGDDGGDGSSLPPAR